MKKWMLWLIPLIGLGVLCFPRWEGSRELPLFQRLATAQVLNAAEKAGASVEETETRLIEKGLPV